MLHNSTCPFGATNVRYNREAYYEIGENIRANRTFKQLARLKCSLTFSNISYFITDSSKT